MTYQLVLHLSFFFPLIIKESITIATNHVSILNLKNRTEQNRLTWFLTKELDLKPKPKKSNSKPKASAIHYYIWIKTDSVEDYKIQENKKKRLVLIDRTDWRWKRDLDCKTPRTLEPISRRRKANPNWERYGQIRFRNFPLFSFSVFSNLRFCFILMIFVYYFYLTRSDN